ncbi:MAG: hypothetical protein GXY83_42615 [Rhodopirellula sp.]|nr:hypothetical protein [Rhodopirellula sp.]
MLKSIFALMTSVAMLAIAAIAQANCGNCGPKAADADKSAAAASSGGSCSAATCAAAQCGTNKGCPVAAAMERLPKLSYAVGQKSTCCPKEAAKLAKESGGHIHFVVAGKEYDSKPEAQTALIEATEKFVDSFTKPHKCSKSGKLTLAGAVQNCDKSAAQTAERMQQAMAKVKLTYAVGEKECGCPVRAAELAKETGKEKLFVVGEEKTGCEKTARLNLARAKFRAAVEAMVQAEAAAPADAPSKES